MNRQISSRLKNVLAIVFLTLLLAIPTANIYAQEHTKHEEHPQEQTEHVEIDAEHHEEGEHGSDMSPLLFIVASLIIGALTRHLLKKLISLTPYHCWFWAY